MCYGWPEVFDNLIDALRVAKEAGMPKEEVLEEVEDIYRENEGDQERKEVKPNDKDRNAGHQDVSQ